MHGSFNEMAAETEASATPSWSTSRLVRGAVAVLLAFGLFLAYSLEASHERYEANAAGDLQNLTLNLDRYFFARFQSADLVLQSAARDFALIEARAGGAQAQAQFSTLLGSLRQQLAESPAIRAADVSGIVRYGPDIDSAHPISIARRRFFQDALQSPGLTIGLPLKSRISGLWVLPLARQIRGADGEPAGIVYLTLEMDGFTRILAPLNIGEHGVIALFNP